MQAVILAAGKGSRLNPITLNRTKAMVPILGKPIVERVMETMVENGVREFIMVISREDGEVGKYFREQSALNANIQFVVQPERLGMANALSLAAPYIHDTFVMSACDNLTPVEHVAQLLNSHRDGRANATLSLMEVDDSVISRTGIVDMQNGNIVRIVEKPALEEAPSHIASLPLYVFSPKLLDYLPEIKPSSRGEYELQDAIQLLIERDGRVTGVLTPTRQQLTNASDLLSLNRHYLTTGGDTPLLAPQSVGKHTHLITPLRIEEKTTIGPGCVIGPRVYIERNCKIGADVLIKDSVILRNTEIEDGRQVVGEVVS
jgi:NDP-sugar pyrophosphorylase family protein